MDQIFYTSNKCRANLYILVQLSSKTTIQSDSYALYPLVVYMLVFEERMLMVSFSRKKHSPPSTRIYARGICLFFMCSYSGQCDQNFLVLVLYVTKKYIQEIYAFSTSLCQIINSENYNFLFLNKKHGRNLGIRLNSYQFGFSLGIGTCLHETRHGSH